MNRTRIFDIIVLVFLFVGNVQADISNTSGGVQKIAQGADKNTLFVAGSLRSTGEASGTFVGLNTANNTIDSSFPKVIGTATSIALDGNGGYFIGGDFTQVGDFKVKHLAHILPNKTVDTSFNLELNGTVRVVRKGVNRLFISGYFTEVSGQSRYRIAALNLNDLSLSDWSPRIDSGFLHDIYERRVGLIYLVYLAGSFTAVDGVNTVENLGLVNEDGDYLSWYPEFNSEVTSVVYSPETSSVFAGGYFTTVNGQERPYIAEFDGLFHVLQGFNPGLDYYVRSLLIEGEDLYLAGGFNEVMGSTRYSLARINIVTDTLHAFNADIDGSVTEIKISDNNIYLGGYINGIGGQYNHKHFGVVNKNTGERVNLSANFNNTVEAIELLGANLLLGGYFTSVASEQKEVIGLSKFNVKKLEFEDYNPVLYGEVYDMKYYRGKLYVAGYLYLINGTSIENFAVIDPKTGELINSDIKTDGYIQSIEVTNKYIFIGGTFTKVNNINRNNFAVIKRSTMELLDNDYQLSGALSGVTAIKYSQGRVFVSGEFTSVNGQPRERIFAINHRNLKVIDSWNQSLDRAAYDFAVLGKDVYTAGIFNEVGGQDSSALVVLNFRNGSLKRQIEEATNIVYSLSLSGPFLNMSGYVALRDPVQPSYPENSYGLAEYNINTKDFTLTSNEFSSYVLNVFSNPKILLAAGDFYGVNGQPQYGISHVESRYYRKNLSAEVEVNGDVATVSFNKKKRSSAVIKFTPLNKNKREYEVFTRKGQISKRLPKGKYKVQILNATNKKRFFESKAISFEIQ